MKKLAAIALLLPGMLSCAPETPAGTFAYLEDDYILTTSDPAFARLGAIRLRYEDDWLPRTCEGVTYLSEQDHVILEWRCQYVINDDSRTGNASLTGGLSDEDGDGIYTGTVVGFPFTDTDTVGPATAATFTMTPCARNGGNGPCSE